MKKTTNPKRLLNLSSFLMIIFFCSTSLLGILAQSNTTKWPQSDKTHSKRARVIIMNGDSSASPNENFYVTWGKHNHWFSQGIRLEVQKERGIGARSGMFMDTSHLYLVGDWDNNSTNEDIIFGFNSNLRGNVHEKMRLTDEGLLGIGINNPTQKLHVKGYGRFQHSSSNFLDLGHGGKNSFINHNGIGNFDFRYEGNNLMTLTQNGKLGIGTTNPNAKLDVNGDTNIIGKTNLNGDVDIKGNTYLKGDLTLSNQDRSQELLVNKGFNIRLSNMANSHFSVQNAFGTDALFVGTNGKMAIGSVNTSELTEQLHVDGRVKARGFIADASSFPDYVFAKDYRLMPLEEVKKYTEANHSLPGMPSEKEIIANGLDLEKVTTISVEKIEELYLHTIKQQELLQAQQNLIQKLEQRILKLERLK